MFGSLHGHMKFRWSGFGEPFASGILVMKGRANLPKSKKLQKRDILNYATCKDVSLYDG